jgi:type IV secretion system protein VirB2
LRTRICVLLAVAALIVVLPFVPAHASAAGGSLPWDTPLQTLSNDIKGPVAFTIALLGLVATGAALLFGGEINEFIRRIIMVVMVISLLVFAANILSTLFATGAVVRACAAFRSSALCTGKTCSWAENTVRCLRPRCSVPGWRSLGRTWRRSSSAPRSGSARCRCCGGWRKPIHR